MKEFVSSSSFFPRAWEPQDKYAHVCEGELADTGFNSPDSQVVPS